MCDFTQDCDQIFFIKNAKLNIMETLDKSSNGYVEIIGIRTIRKKALAKLRNSTIGFIFQYHYLLPEFTARENILMHYRITTTKSKRSQ